ncbi:tetratricopeptide repeat protein [Sphingobium aquiterrae]|uniref:tetratricopeptide repeat protein n=1 Tax=Sphingobium aquiterrae TaxID=2038656 RepID=UPI0030176DD3
MTLHRTAAADLLAMSADEMRTQLATSPEAAAGLLQAGAQAGLPEAQALYGQILLDGRGVAADPVAALKWFLQAARSGHLMAINMVGRCHEKGWGTAIDKGVATLCYKAAAEGGLDWGMYNYGSALGLGSGIARDERAALDWFRKAAALGHAKSINFVGAFFEEGRLVPQDIDKAAACYKRAAEGDDFRGQFNHARMLAQAGRPDEAAAWLMKADETCTPDFRQMMKTFLEASPLPALRTLASRL